MPLAPHQARGYFFAQIPLANALNNAFEDGSNDAGADGSA